MTTSTLRQDDTDGLPKGARRAALLTITIAISASVMASIIANIALPSMTHELHTTPGDAIWVVNAYQLAVTVSLLPLSALGDIAGYRRVYMGGLAMFTLASFACGFAETLPLLVAARVFQGFGAAGIMSVNTALVRFIVPREQLGRGVATVALVVATSSAAGPSVAAAILLGRLTGTGCSCSMCPSGWCRSGWRSGHCPRRPCPVTGSTGSAPF